MKKVVPGMVSIPQTILTPEQRAAIEAYLYTSMRERGFEPSEYRISGFTAFFSIEPEEDE